MSSKIAACPFIGHDHSERVNFMKRFFLAAAVAATALPALAEPNIGVSVSVNQPGFYGRIDLGDVQQPQVVVVNPQPVVVAPSPVAVYQQPIYLRVPPGHARQWSRYCGRYGACGQPVYFVQEQWYQQRYLPGHRGYRGHDGRDDRHHDRRDWREDHHDDRDRDDHGKGHGRGH